jgi:hypothetical protein
MGISRNDIFKSVLQVCLDKYIPEGARSSASDIARGVVKLTKDISEELPVTNKVTHFIPAKGWRALIETVDGKEKEEPLGDGLLCSFDDGGFSIMVYNKTTGWEDVATWPNFRGFVGPTS